MKKKKEEEIRLSSEGWTAALRGNSYFPHTKVLYVYVRCSIPSAGCYRSAPRNYLVGLSSALSSTSSPASTVDIFVNFYPRSILFSIFVLVKPDFHFNDSLSIPFRVIHYGFEADPLVFYRAHGSFVIRKDIGYMPLFFCKPYSSIVAKISFVR